MRVCGVDVHRFFVRSLLAFFLYFSFHCFACYVEGGDATVKSAHSITTYLAPNDEVEKCSYARSIADDRGKNSYKPVHWPQEVSILR